MSESGKVSAKQEAFLVVLLGAASIEAAARQAGINPVTAWRWLKQPAFAEAYRSARRQAVQHAVALIQTCTTDAVSTLLQVMRDPEAPASAKVSAARVILETAIHGLMVDDYEARLLALEAAQKGG